MAINKQDKAKFIKNLHVLVDKLLDRNPLNVQVINKLTPIYGEGGLVTKATSRGQILIIETGTHELLVESLGKFIEAKYILPDGTEIQLP